MNIIYTPSGKAREYSPLAANLYNGCNHGCSYCFAAEFRGIVNDKFKTPVPRQDVISKFASDCKKIEMSPEPVLFCFMTDPYNRLEPKFRITRQCLEWALTYKIPVSILTKNMNVFNDIDIIKDFGPNIEVGFTLTLDNEKDSRAWEPEASLPEERLGTLYALHKEGVRTWASFEPVIDIRQSLTMMEMSLEYVDVYKIGRLNHSKEDYKDYNSFLFDAVRLLRMNDKKFYVKEDLRKITELIELRPEEKDMDFYNLKNQFKEYCKSGNKPDFIPADPKQSYGIDKWKGPKDWIGIK